MRVSPTLILAAIAIGPAPSAMAQTYEQSRQLCLVTPGFVEGFVKACTIVVNSPHTSPLERAIALNNRATQETGEDAKRDLDEAIRLAPKLAKLFNNRGLHLMYPEPIEALADFDEAIRLDPHYAVAWNNRGETYAALKQYDRAIENFNEAIRLAPGYLHPMYNPYEQRAQAREAKGDLKGAEIDRKRYMPLWDRASSSKTDVRGANVIGSRAWEPFISLLEAKALSRN